MNIFPWAFTALIHITNIYLELAVIEEIFLCYVTLLIDLFKWSLQWLEKHHFNFFHQEEMGDLWCEIRKEAACAQMNMVSDLLSDKMRLIFGSLTDDSYVSFLIKPQLECLLPTYLLFQNC